VSWRSPVTGRLLEPDTPHSLAADGERWPVVDSIPYLRAGREALVADALARLDAGQAREALVALLADQDDWWTGPATDPAELARLVRDRHALSLREAMALLRLGPVADYFAYRWSDPTYLAGLALLEAHWASPDTAFELACGIGHYLRDLTRRGVAALGADVVFAKCWMAKHWVAPEADYVVFDAAHPWPIGERRFDLVQCHDAFYFLSDQPTVAARLRAAGGTLAISHVHNSGVTGAARGPARTAAEWAALFPNATVYDEAALLAALVEGQAPVATSWTDDPAVEAWSLVEKAGPARALTGGLALPTDDAALRPNPLLGENGPNWPSDRYRDEYAASPWARPGADADPIRTRILVDLPERW